MYKVPRGTADILPQEQAYWRFVQGKAEALCHLYGYQRLDTPVFEEAGLFIRTIGPTTDIVEKEMYTFQDRGGKDLTLRPEGTAPVCRAYLGHGPNNLPPALDAEVIDLAWQFYSSLGLKGLSLKLNSIGCRACRPDYVKRLRQYYEHHTPRLCYA